MLIQPVISVTEQEKRMNHFLFIFFLLINLQRLPEMFDGFVIILQVNVNLPVFIVTPGYAFIILEFGLYPEAVKNIFKGRRAISELKKNDADFIVTSDDTIAVVQLTE